MKKYFWIYTIFFVTLWLQGCEKETMVYEGEPDQTSGIYFLYSSSYTMSGNVRKDHYQDSIEISFAQVTPNVMEQSIGLPVKILGNIADYDRVFKAKVVGGTAVEGVDYEPLKEEYIVPANAASVKLPLVLKRTEKLKKSKLDITIQLIENENFKLLLPSKINDDGVSEINTTRIKVVFSEIYKEPRMYNLFGKELFGPFTITKFEYINTIMEWAPADWENNVVTAGILSYAVRRVQAELQARADNNDPVYDEDGSFMQLESPYTVDYSKYEIE